MNRDHFREIYAAGAEQYDALVSREDYQSHILPALAAICPIEGAAVIEMGAGTGRMTRLLAPVTARIHAFDGSAHMLATARRRLEAQGATGWTLAAADNAALPIASACADLCIAGWSFGHATGWYPDSWQQVIGAALAEMRRVLRPGGTAIILETLGTGHDTPTPPSPTLAAYYAWLEGTHGFDHAWIRTDYQFASVPEAEQLTRFFFGDPLADRIVTEGTIILPECTGLWYRTF